MTPAHYVALLSAILGAAGTIVLFIGSYALQPREGAPFGSAMLVKANAHIDAVNAARVITQRVGLAFLCASFFAQGVAVFLDLQANHEEWSIDAWLLTIEPLMFLGLAIVLFGLLAVLSYQKKTASAFIVLLGAVFSATFVYIDHVSEIAATATSLTIKVREASDALTGLKKLAALTGEAIISWIQRLGPLVAIRKRTGIVENSKFLMYCDP